MSIKAPSEKNFRRARARPARRKGGRGWRSWRAARHVVCAALGVYAAYRTFNLVVNASALRVQHISVHGNVRLSAGEVQTLVGNLRGTSILTADLPAFRRRLLLSPWVADVALRRVLPSTVEVFVSERRPMGLCRIGNQMYLVDRLGIVIDAMASQRDLAQRVSQIDVADLHDAVVLLDGDQALLHLGEDRFLERLQSYLDVASALRERVADIDYVDLRFDQRMYVRSVTVKHKQP